MADSAHAAADIARINTYPTFVRDLAVVASFSYVSLWLVGQTDDADFASFRKGFDSLGHND